MSQIRETTLEIDLKALAHNYRHLQSKTSKNTRFMGVVKAFAYGSDAVRIARELEKLGVDYLATAFVKEAVLLRKNGIKKPILAFQLLPTDYESCLSNQITPTLYSLSGLNAFAKVAEKHKLQEYPVHLNLNTGMNRLGFEETEIDEVITQLRHNHRLKVEGIYSHFVASDKREAAAFSRQQIRQFKQMTHKISTALDYRPWLHLCNTSGILNFPEAHFDMVRTGIGLYGFGNSAQADQNLQAIASLKTIITQIHQLKTGESVSYNRNFTAKKPSKVATLPLGYADGYHRIYGNGKTAVIINGQPAPVIGDVCMDMMMADVTNIVCQEGDEVHIFGREKNTALFAHQAGTISYEVLTAISQRVQRKIIV